MSNKNKNIEFDENFLDDIPQIDLDHDKSKLTQQRDKRNKFLLANIDIEKILSNPQLKGICEREKYHYKTCISVNTNKARCQSTFENIMICFKKNGKILY